MYALRDLLARFGLGGMPAFWATIGIAVAAVLAGLYFRHIRLWLRGRPESRWDRMPERVAETLKDIFGHRKLLADNYAGAMHAMLFAAGSFLIIVHVPAIRSRLWNHRIVFGTFREIAGLGLMIGAIMAAARRIRRRSTGDLPTTIDDVAVLALLFLLGATGVLINSFGAMTPLRWAGYRLLDGVGIEAELKPAMWMLHTHVALGVLAFVAVGYTKLSHLFIVPLNLFFRLLKPWSVPHSLDLENPDTFGVAHLGDLTWKDLMDLDACMRCGRCEQNCPAVAAGTPLNPRQLIADLKRFAHGAGLNGAADTKLVGTAIGDGAVWACTQCFGCAERCPVAIDVPSKLLELRRNLMLVDGNVPADLAAVARNLETRGHPWVGINQSRTAWAKGISGAARRDGAEVLLWVGCTGAMVERAQRQTASVARLLDRAGVAYTILGDEEGCCGHFARRLGAEHLFQAFVEQNTALIKATGVKRIVASCPHCMHTLRNEYDLGIEVVHHTEFLLELVRQGRLDLSAAADGRVTYHDPCYLARQNSIVDEPRGLLSRIPGIEFADMEPRGADAFCCGGGGGQIWRKDSTMDGASVRRARQAIDTGAQVVLTGCPNCTQMLENGLSSAKADATMRVLNVAEYLMEATQQTR